MCIVESVGLTERQLSRMAPGRDSLRGPGEACTCMRYGLEHCKKGAGRLATEGSAHPARALSTQRTVEGLLRFGALGIQAWAPLPRCASSLGTVVGQRWRAWSFGFAPPILDTSRKLRSSSCSNLRTSSGGSLRSCGADSGVQRASGGFAVAAAQSLERSKPEKSG